MADTIDECEVLKWLGLSINEARVFLALSTVESATAKAVSRNAKMAREIVYRVIPRLEEKGLVETILTTPKRFKAVPMEEALRNLLEKRTEELIHKRTKIERLIQQYGEGRNKLVQFKDNQSFILIPPSILLKRIAEALERTQKTVDLYLSWKRFSSGITEVFREKVQRALTRGVKLRIVAEIPLRHDPEAGNIIKQCMSTSNLHLKFVQKVPETVIGIYDRKEVFIITDPDAPLNGSFALWSDNRSIISLAQEFFEIVWLTSIENVKIEVNDE